MGVNYSQTILVDIYAADYDGATDAHLHWHSIPTESTQIGDGIIFKKSQKSEFMDPKGRKATKLLYH